MQLRKQLEADGDWLFQHRSFVPLLLVPVLLAALTGSAHTPRTMAFSDLAGFVFAAVGLLIRAGVVGYIPPGTSGRNMRRQRAAELNTTGLYSLVRHPLYVGNFLVAIGWSMASASGWLVFVVALLCCLYYERIAIREEEFLFQRFGNAFARWADQTPACLPNALRWNPPDRSFDWSMLVRREYQTVCLVVAGFVLVHLLRAALNPFAALEAERWIMIGAADGAVFALSWIAIRRFKLFRQPATSRAD